jgi:4-alpha-glucanotransferase
MCAALQFAIPGVPSIYYGDEQGMEGVGDPFNRAPFKEGDQDLHDWYQYLSALRRSADALSTGRAAFFASDSEVMIVLRYITDGKVVFGDAAENSVWLCVLNRSGEERAYSVDCAAAGLGVHTGVAAPLSGEIIRLL